MLIGLAAAFVQVVVQRLRRVGEPCHMAFKREHRPGCVLHRPSTRSCRRGNWQHAIVDYSARDPAPSCLRCLLSTLLSAEDG